MTAAERNRRKRRLEAAGFKALPTGWIRDGDFYRSIVAQLEAFRGKVAEMEARELPLGRPKKPKLLD